MIRPLLRLLRRARGGRTYATFVDLDEAPVAQRWESVLLDEAGGPYACPCCRFITLLERGAFELCPVCFWEDDGQDECDADRVRGGPNGGLSLQAARANYSELGACAPDFVKKVRPPRGDELPPA